MSIDPTMLAALTANQSSYAGTVAALAADRADLRERLKGRGIPVVETRPPAPQFQQFRNVAELVAAGIPVPADRIERHVENYTHPNGEGWVLREIRDNGDGTRSVRSYATGPLAASRTIDDWRLILEEFV